MDEGITTANDTARKPGTHVPLVSVEWEGAESPTPSLHRQGEGYLVAGLGMNPWLFFYLHKACGGSELLIPAFPQAIPTTLEAFGFHNLLL